MVRRHAYSLAVMTSKYEIAALHPFNRATDGAGFTIFARSQSKRRLYLQERSRIRHLQQDFRRIFDQLFVFFVGAVRVELTGISQSEGEAKEKALSRSK